MNHKSFSEHTGKRDHTKVLLPLMAIIVVLFLVWAAYNGYTLPKNN